MAKEVVQQRGLAIRLACAVFSISESCYRYESRQNAENEIIADWLIRLTDIFADWIGWFTHGCYPLTSGRISPNCIIRNPAVPITKAAQLSTM